jgi:hypothetical protein
LKHKRHHQDQPCNRHEYIHKRIRVCVHGDSSQNFELTQQELAGSIVPLGNGMSSVGSAMQLKILSKKLAG